MTIPRLMQVLAAALMLCAAAPSWAQGATARILIQDSPLAGFQYYDGKTLWDDMKPGESLTLRREPENPHDANAIRIEWKGRMLGYVPRHANSDLARQMDHGAAVEARITELVRHRNGRNRVSYEIFVPLN